MFFVSVKSESSTGAEYVIILRQFGLFSGLLIWRLAYSDKMSLSFGQCVAYSMAYIDLLACK